MIDLGTAQIDATLLSVLHSAGVPDEDARELARTDRFGGCNAQAWLAGLRSAAAILNGSKPAIDWGTMPSPWDNIGPALANANGIGPAKALESSVSVHSPDIQLALIGAIGRLAAELSRQAESIHEMIPGAQLPPSQVRRATESAAGMAPPDAALVKAIQRALEHGGGSREQRRKKAGEYVLDWLLGHGKFIRTVYGAKYYLFTEEHKLFPLDTSRWLSWLYVLTAVNPASTAFRYITADCEAAAEFVGEVREVVRVAHWDADGEVLRVSRFDGQVYRLDGTSMETENNGDGPVLFDDAPFWSPYTPDFSGSGSVLDWSLGGIPNWDGCNEEYSLIYKLWVIATFFTEVCPTRPILVFKGEKGSGKSMGLRVLLRLMFGPAADVQGVPDKADGFTAATSNNHIVCLDNMDDFNKEIRDKVARLSTGSTDQVRKLYTTNETYTIRYRCWLAVTSRTPDTLQRDDLVDRILILPVKRLEDSKRRRESAFLQDVFNRRDVWWGDILTTLNAVVHHIRQHGIPERGGLRMEDYAAFGTAAAIALNQADVWEQGLAKVRDLQSNFLLEDDAIVAAIGVWLSSQLYTSSPLSTRDLYSSLQSSAFGMRSPDKTWPSSTKSFGRRLAGILKELTEHLAKDGIVVSTKISRGNLYYQFARNTTFQAPLPSSP